MGMPVSSVVPEPFPTEELERDLEKALPSDNDDVVEVDPNEEAQAIAYEEAMLEIEEGIKAFSLY
jgi:hypothetical protein